MSSHRIEKVNELLRQELSLLIRREVEFKKGSLVTVIQVDTDADLKATTVWVSVVPAESAKGALSLLAKRKPLLQHHINKHLAMRHVPQLTFKLQSPEVVMNDPGDEVERLLDEISGK